jgi:hypothetical protein
MTVAEREPGLKNRGHLSSITANAPITNPYSVILSESASSLAKKRRVEGPLDLRATSTRAVANPPSAMNRRCRISIIDVSFVLSDQHHCDLRSRSICAALVVFHVIQTIGGAGWCESCFSGSVEHYSSDSLERSSARHGLLGQYSLDFRQPGRGRYQCGDRSGFPRYEFLLQGDTNSSNDRRNQRSIHVESKNLHSMVTGEGGRIQQR